ncbi:HD domain-containing protein [Metabacillus iocasae]|uniref:HD superfamily phosphohydrolase n=1 Tax=Priestia iocasae TaxID=2291674 RepID=A0ABS2QU58_9BACI|nr:HD domain-containing protein [Metabacillus iocasae]MBM7702950.1 HD superfamily phosphohydrolase [Metabacillus iocasae]
MNIKDCLYGEHVIDGVLEELLLSAPVQRLKGVYQGGATYIVNEKWNVTRYEHSVGVMLLIRRLGGSIEEQMAGLLHDVSHTAFSHVIDFALDNKNEDYHEHIYEQVIKQSTIPAILQKYGYDAASILGDDSQWTLLEQSAPELCADRVDYTLRDMYRYGVITKEAVTYFLENLLVVNGRMYPRHIEAAEWFVETYYKEVIDYFLHPLVVYGYDALSKALKIALNEGVIEFDDLLREDEDVLAMLRQSDNEQLRKTMKLLHRHACVEENHDTYDIHLKGKVRLIDPSVPQGGELVQASKLSQRVQQLGKRAYEQSKQGTYVRII